MDLVSEHHWLSLVRRYENNEQRFRALFGGMGSFNDLFLHNGHTISKDKEMLANIWLECLASLCCTLTKYEDMTGEGVVSGFRTLGEKLEGVCCFECGVSHVVSRNVVLFYLHYSTRTKIREGIEQGKLNEVFLDEWNTFDDAKVVSRYLKILEESNIYFLSTFDINEPCSDCGNDNSVIYRGIGMGKYLLKH